MSANSVLLSYSSDLLVTAVKDGRPQTIIAQLNKRLMTQ
jgi:hypothetical protein